MANRVNIGPKGSKLDWDNWGKPMTDAVNDHDDQLLNSAEVRDGAIATSATILASAAYGTETEITLLRVDAQSVISGGAYLFLGQTQYVPSATGCEWEIRLREDTISGTIIGTTRLSAVATASFGYPLHWYFIWKCAATNASKRFVYTIQRNAGAGNVALNGTSGSGACTHMSLLRMGSSGVVRSI